jgi:hypothetical protein
MAQAPIYYPDSLLEVDCVLLLERLKKPVPESPREVFAANLAHVSTPAQITQSQAR